MNSSRLFCAVVFVLTLAPPVRAENWPSRAMNLIVPFAAGGGVEAAGISVD
jgi:tripartite-type tricarboxylate transporter receptor subunit TctC